MLTISFYNLNYSQFSPEWTSCHPSEPSIFSKMVMIWQQSWTAKSDYSRKYSDVILQTLIRDPPKGCKRLKKKKKWRPRNFFTQQSITDISADKNNQLTDVSSHLIHLGEIVKIKKFDNFDWKLVLSSISQGQSYNQKVALFRCPSDLTNFVKICAFVQSLEVILERSDSLGWELPVENRHPWARWGFLV